MAVSQDQLSSQLKQLKRSPAPKAPVPSSPTSPVGMGAIDLSSVKLKKTGKRESLIENDFDIMKENKVNDMYNEHDAFAAKRKMFEQGRNKPATLPRLKPKPKIDDLQKPRSDSLPDSISDVNQNVEVKKGGFPKLKPLPTLQSLGLKPPDKPPKPLLLTMKIEKKYKNHTVVMAPKVKSVIIEEEEDDNEVSNAVDDVVEEGEDIYDDINAGGLSTNPPFMASSMPSTEPELIEEDTYDDVEQLAEVVKSQLAQAQASQNKSVNGNEEEFGEDIYQPVEETFLPDNGIDEDIEDIYEDEPPPEITSPPPPSRESKEDPKAKKEREKKEKELQKKKEKDEQKRKKEEERREREEKKKKEEEKKKKDKIDKELKRVHKLKGNEPAIAKGTAKDDCTGNGNKDLSFERGSVIEIITKDGCPNNRWLGRDQQGHLGYILPAMIVSEENAEESTQGIDEDLYECVDTFQTNTHLSANVDTTEDFYDDTVVGDEDFYEDLPGGN